MKHCETKSFTFFYCMYLQSLKNRFYVTIYIEKIKSPQEYKHGWSRDQIL